MRQIQKEIKEKEYIFNIRLDEGDEVNSFEKGYASVIIRMVDGVYQWYVEYD